MTKSDRLEREKLFHNQRFGTGDSERTSVGKYYSANLHSNQRYFEIVSKLCRGKKLLEYGCGRGGRSKQWLKFGARVTGIDISEEGIKQANNNLKNSKFEAEYYVMDAEHTDFDDNSFDLVVGTGILHHLDLTTAYQELSRICKTDGHIVFVEPLGHNPIINFFRFITPKMRTEDEHPLKMKDITLLRQYFDKVNVEYFSLFTLLSVPFRTTPFFTKLNDILRAVDKVVFSIPFVGRYAWVVIIHASTARS